MSASDRWERASALFDEAVDLDVPARKRLLDEACAGDTALREEVESLLRAHERSGLLERPLDELAAEVELVVVEPDEVLPERIGPFEPLEELGRGGMGVVYKARDPRLDRYVAVKLLPPVLQDDEAARRRLLREARASSALDHPNICTIFDVGETSEGLVFVAMAYYRGKTLAELIAEGPLAVPAAIDLACQMADGLEHAHEAGIVHRDVKPSNVIVNDRGIAKILDFGIARREGGSEVTAPGLHVGTVAYMSPERIDGDAGGPPTDVWSLGVVLFEMLTGSRPFEGATVAELVRSIETDEAPKLWRHRPDAPEALETILRRALSRRPGERYRSAGEMATELRALLSAVRSPLSVHLPAEPTSFVGREKELLRLSALLSGARLVTLTGPAGTGKSRLAIHAARRQARGFLHGVHFVALESIGEPDLVAPTLARSLGLVEPSGSARERLVQALSDKEMLLVLDNFEQVSAAAPLVSELLERCPRLTVLATSRVPLHLAGEQELPLAPLELPPSPSVDDVEEHGGTRLFLERARAVRPELELTAERAAAVAEICRRLDGLPLAIEIAAARVKLFLPEVLLEELGTRLDLLEGGARDRPSRHQTLRSAIRWSYELLDDGDKRLFRRLGLFVGGFTLEAAERVRCAPPAVEVDLVGAVEGLVARSLLQASGSGRFAMLRTVRSFALAELETDPDARSAAEAQARFFLELSERAEPELTGPSQTVWLDRLEEEHDNLRALLGRDDEVALRLGAAIWRFWLARGYLREWRDRLTRLLALEASRADAGLRARLLQAAGTLAHNGGDNLGAREFLEECLALSRACGDERGVATTLNNLAWVACELGELDSTVRLSEEAFGLHERLGDRRGMALSLNNLGWVANYRGESRAGRRFHGQSLALRREIGDERGIAFTLANLAWAEMQAGRFETAETCLEEALERVRPVQDPIITGWVLLTTYRVQKSRGELERAASALGEALPFWQEGGNPSGIAWARTELAELLTRLGKRESARELAGEALRGWRAVGGRWGEALTLHLLARLAPDAESGEIARSAYAIFDAIGAPLGRAECMEWLAELHSRAGRARQAAELLGAAATLRETIEAPLPPVESGSRDALVARLRSELGTEALAQATRRGCNLSSQDLVRALV